jgi:channel protein (hemolysin III family)
LSITASSILSVPGFADPVSCWTHLLGAVVALIAGIRLVYGFRGPGLIRFGLILFVFGTLFMFSMSGVYHLLGQGTARAVLRRLDHAAIWVMIAGSFTPIHLIHFRGWARWGVLGFVWLVAINGIVFKTVFFDSFPAVLGMSLYLGLGWFGMLSVFLLTRSIGFRGTLPMIYGGLAYSVGALIELLQPPQLVSGVVGPHEIFHFGVIAGATFHWRFISQAAATRGSEAG